MQSIRGNEYVKDSGSYCGWLFVVVLVVVVVSESFSSELFQQTAGHAELSCGSRPVSNMKFGQYLLDNKYPEWADQYLDYDTLKKIIKSVEVVSYTADLLCGVIILPLYLFVVNF